MSVPLPDQSGLKQQLIRAHLLSQAGETEGYESHKWGVWGVPSAAKACGKLLQLEAGRVLFQGSRP